MVTEQASSRTWGRCFAGRHRQTQPASSTLCWTIEWVNTVFSSYTVVAFCMCYSPITFSFSINIHYMYMSMYIPSTFTSYISHVQGHSLRAMNCIKLHKRAERIGAQILDKLKLNSGDHIALLYPPGIELIVAFYGCLYVGMVPVIIRPPLITNLPGALPTIKLTLQISNSRAILSSNIVLKWVHET